MDKLETLHRRLVERGPEGNLELGLVLLLRGLAWIYGFGVWLRSLTFRCGIRRSYRSRLPVVSVGNLAVGGTGKTPLVDLLIRSFQQKGLRVAVVSRGYGGGYSGPLGIVSVGEGPLLAARIAGDEPVLLAKRNPQAVVLVAAQRRLALKWLEDNNCADLVILDDAFQHRQVARDLDLVLLDAQRPFGNHRLLPAGILREPESALARADLICLTGVVGDGTAFAEDPSVVGVRSALASIAISLNGDRQSLQELSARKIFAFAGIGRPERFFSALAHAGITVHGSLALADHVNYDAAVVAQINELSADAEILMTTEKDAVKLTAGKFKRPCFSVGLDLQLEKRARSFRSTGFIVR